MREKDQKVRDRLVFNRKMVSSQSTETKKAKN